MSTQFHENLSRDGDEPVATERSFGLLFAGVFAIVGLLPLLKDHGVRAWALGLAVVFLVAGLALPRILRPFNRIWMGIGKIMHRVVSPVVLGLLYTVAVVPTGWFLRLRGADPLRLKRDAAAKSYWIPRARAPISFKNQF